MPSYIVGGKASAAGLLAAEEAFERNATHMSPLQRALHEPAWKGGAAPGEEGAPKRCVALGSGSPLFWWKPQSSAV